MSEADNPPPVDPFRRPGPLPECAKCGKPIRDYYTHWIGFDRRDYHYDCRPEQIVKVTEK